jgi:hypothetical protein
MKRANLILYVAATLTISLLFSCDKDDNPEPAGLTGPLIHKWNLVKYIDTISHTFYGNFYYTYMGTGNDFLDFNKNGKLYYHQDFIRDTASFYVNSDNESIHIENPIRVPHNFIFRVDFLSDDSLHLSATQYNLSSSSHDSKRLHYYMNRK